MNHCTNVTAKCTAIVASSNVSGRVGAADPCRADCPFQRSYVFGEGRFHCALVSKWLSTEQAAAVMRYFISAHKGSEEG